MTSECSSEQRNYRDYYRLHSSPFRRGVRRRTKGKGKGHGEGRGGEGGEDEKGDLAKTSQRSRQSALASSASNFSLSVSGFACWKSFGTEVLPPSHRTARGCFKQEEEDRLEVGLDAVALGRNIDHGVGGRAAEGENETRGAGGVSAHPLFRFSLGSPRRHRERRERGARGQRDQLKRYNGPTRCIHTSRIPGAR